MTKKLSMKKLNKRVLQIWCRLILSLFVIYFTTLLASELVFKVHFSLYGVRSEWHIITVFLILASLVTATGVGAFFASEYDVLGRLRRVRSIVSVRQSNPQQPLPPPKHGMFLLYLFLPKKRREALIGDMEEEYQEVAAKYGEHHANVWFYKQVLTSLWPMIQAAGRSLVKWGFVVWLEEIIRRIAH